MVEVDGSKVVLAIESPSSAIKRLAEIFAGRFFYKNNV